MGWIGQNAPIPWPVCVSGFNAGERCPIASPGDRRRFGCSKASFLPHVASSPFLTLALGRRWGFSLHGPGSPLSLF